MQAHTLTDSEHLLLSLVVSTALPAPLPSEASLAMLAGSLPPATIRAAYLRLSQLGLIEAPRNGTNSGDIIFPTPSGIHLVLTPRGGEH